MVVVWKLDRISRRQRDGVNLLAEWRERGVRVVAVTQQIDLSGAVGRMVASVSCVGRWPARGSRACRCTPRAGRAIARQHGG